MRVGNPSARGGMSGFWETIDDILGSGPVIVQVPGGATVGVGTPTIPVNRPTPGVSGSISGSNSILLIAAIAAFALMARK